MKWANYCPHIAEQVGFRVLEDGERLLARIKRFYSQHRIRPFSFYKIKLQYTCCPPYFITTRFCVFSKFGDRAPKKGILIMTRLKNYVLHITLMSIRNIPQQAVNINAPQNFGYPEIRVHTT